MNRHKKQTIPNKNNLIIISYNSKCLKNKYPFRKINKTFQNNFYKKKNNQISKTNKKKLLDYYISKLFLPFINKLKKHTFYKILNLNKK